MLESGVIQKIPPAILEELKEEDSKLEEGKPQENPLTLKSVHSLTNIQEDDSPRLQQEDTTAAGTSEAVEGLRLPPVGSLNIPEILISHTVTVHHSLYVGSGSNMKIYEYSLNSWATA